ncbi:MAG: Resolvase domain protein [Hyphomicrobiales bacterium]|nr:Resolvase domain protein [Hyphomicrobiales bacterium]
MPADKVVVYYRLSTDGARRHGLDVREQECAVSKVVRDNGAIVATFTELEARHVLDRPKLGEAIGASLQAKADLLIPRLGALAHDATFLTIVHRSGVSFRCLDVPDADQGSVKLMIKLAEQRAMTSMRIKAALKATKDRLGSLSGEDREARRRQGLPVRLGGAIISPGARATSARNRKAAAAARADFFALTISQLRSDGHVSMKALAEALNKKQVPRASGSTDWTPARVARLVSRLGPRLRGYEST